MAIRKYAKTVDVLKFDEAESYDHDRPISGLIRTQLLHLHTAEHLHLPPTLRSDVNINNLQTERQASEYISLITAALHKHGQASQRAEQAHARRAAAREDQRPAAPKTKTAVGAPGGSQLGGTE